MDDCVNCPICGNKLRNIHLLNYNLLFINKISNYTERTCAGINHSLQFWADKSTSKIDLIKFSLNSKYSKYIEIDFFNKKSRLSCWNNSVPYYINFNKIINPDFPNLISLTDKISTYLSFH